MQITTCIYTCQVHIFPHLEVLVLIYDLSVYLIILQTCHTLNSDSFLAP